MNINAPIYVPQYIQNESAAVHYPIEHKPEASGYDTGTDYYTNKSISSGSGYSGGISSGNTRDNTLATTVGSSYLRGGQNMNQNLHLGQQPSLKPQSMPGDETQKLKAELIMKNQIIKNLTDQLSALTKQQGQGQTHPVAALEEPWTLPVFQVPLNHYQLFVDLSHALESTTEELEDTRSRLEAFVTAASLNPGQLASSSNRYDEQEMTHRIVGKMAMLQEENERLLTMMSYGNRTSLLVEVGVLRNELANVRGE